MQVHSMPAGGTAGEGDIVLFSVMTKLLSFSEEDGWFFSKMHSYKTPVLHFNFETCSAQFIQPSTSLLENLFVAVSFDIVMGATNKSMYGKHWTLSNGHKLNNNKNKKILILAVKCCPIMSNIYIYAFSRRFYPKRHTIAFRLYIFISTCVPWESNPQPFAQLTQCSTTEPHRNTNVICSLMS